MYNWGFILAILAFCFWPVFAVLDYSKLARGRFGLRSLLIAMTLIAAAIAIVVIEGKN